ncbi:hypothetical protein ACXDJ5_005595 [Klebsiella pneumoniae]
MGEISVKTGNNARNGGKNSLNRLIRCVCGKKIGPDPRNFNQRVSLGRNDLLIRTFLSVYLNHGVFQFISKHYLYDYGMYLWQGASVLLIAVTAPVLYKYVELAFQAKKASSLSIMVKP